MNRPEIFERDLYFGDMPLEKFARLGTEVEPWPSFENARALVAGGDLPRAREVLEAIARMPGIETRFRLQAWHSLREAGGPVAR